jgi:ankyrin repeat protein
VPSLINEYKQSGFDLFAIAVRRNELLIAETLLKKYGVDPNSGQAFGIAITQENIPMIKLLLEYGANPDLPMIWGGTARKRALKRGKDNPELLELIESFDK